MDPPMSLHVCSFHIPHMDPQVSLKCVFSTESTHGSTSVIACVFFLVTTTSVIACVFFLVTTTRVILHVCSFHIPPMDPPVSLKCLLFSPTTHGSTSVVPCVFFSQSTYGSTSVIACVLFSNNNQCHCMCSLFRDHTWIHQCHCMCVLFTNNNKTH